MTATTILLLGASLAAAFTWGRALDRSWRLRAGSGAHVETAWQHMHVSNEYRAKGPNSRRRP